MALPPLIPGRHTVYAVTNIQRLTQGESHGVVTVVNAAALSNALGADLGDLSAMTSSLLDFTFRVGKPDDLGYVINTWENSMRHRYREAKRSDYAAQVRNSLNIWLMSGTDLYVAEQDGLIAGWLLCGMGTVVYCYVRRRFRRQGVAKQLLNSAAIDTDELRVRYMTDTVQQLIEAGKNIRYVPYI